ncbi:cohesin domain-containing protein [Candidatus Poribacteria bacterium]
MTRFQSSSLRYFIFVILSLMPGWLYAEVFVVDSLKDTDDDRQYILGDGTNTLRKCIRLANRTPGADTIEFSVSGTIFASAALPKLNDYGTVIDAGSQWNGVWPTAQPGIVLDGSNAGRADGLAIAVAEGCHIRGMFITNFNGDGVVISDGARDNTVGGSGIGYRNVISGNSKGGLAIRDPGTARNVVSGNYIGTDVTGAVGLGNARYGVLISDGAQSNIIGGRTDAERNIISGNYGEYTGGVKITGLGTNSNRISGNYIGTDVTGTVALGNSSDGISFWDGPQLNIVGGKTEGERNIVSGNVMDGIFFWGAGTSSNVVSGNYIGTDAAGNAALGNGKNGVEMNGDAESNIVGGTTTGERNIISANGAFGIAIYSEARNTIVSGNYIGTNANGTSALGNLMSGVHVSADSAIVGGKTPGERNVISGNGAGIGIDSSMGVVSGNYIGTDVTGTVALGNTWVGIWLAQESRSNIIGGSSEAERNVISGNHSDGVHIARNDSHWGEYGPENNVVSGNYIGTDVTGTAKLGNGGHGVAIYSEVQSNVIGGIDEGKRNIISGNDKDGVYIEGPGTHGNEILGNYIGTNVSGTADLGNSENGIHIWWKAQSNIIGGTSEGERNVISGNGDNGVKIAGIGTSNNIVSGNFIGTDVNGVIDLGNAYNGILVRTRAQSNTVTLNTIAFNDGSGAKIQDIGTHHNRISRNSMYGNASLGIELEYGGNNEIPAPIVESKNLSGGILIVSGSGAGANATVEIFTADSLVSSEGKTYLGDLTANEDGGFSGILDVAAVGLSSDDPIVATTTHIEGNTSEFSVPLTVSEPSAPIADFWSKRVADESPLTMRFTDSSYGEPTSWLWDLGDGKTSDLETFIHTYTTPGYYTVSLTVENEVGSDTKMKLHHVSETFCEDLITATEERTFDRITYEDKTPGVVYLSMIGGDTPSPNACGLNPRNSPGEWTGLGHVDTDNVTVFDHNFIIMGGVLFERGIGSHAEATIIYDLTGGNYTRFECYAGMPDKQKVTGCERSGSVDFTFIVDGEMIAGTGVLVGEYTDGRSPMPVRVMFDIPPGAKELTIAVGDGDNGNDCDYVCLGDAKLITPKPRVLSISPATAPPGTSTIAQLRIDDATDIASGDMVIDYDASVITIDEVTATGLLSGIFLITNIDVPGEIRLSMAGATGLLEGSGALIEITLTVNADAEVGTEATLSFGNAAIYDELGVAIPVSLGNGVVRLSGIKGDVNNDGEVRSNDAALTLRIAAGLLIPTEHQHWAADMNDDDEVGANDATLILRIAAGIAAPRMVAWRQEDTEIGRVSPSQITVALGEAHGVAGERVTVPIRSDGIGILASGEICIAYDSAVLRAVDALSDTGVLLVTNTSEPGILRIAFASADRLGSQTIANIQFDILNYTSSLLKFRSLKLYGPDTNPLHSTGIDRELISWSMIPEYNTLLQNFPNPFNPETWIPYQLAEDSEVTVRIYGATGQLVRTMNLGYRESGSYVSQSRAAHWDGNNEAGESVASGIYFYSIQADDYTATRKMIVTR